MDLGGSGEGLGVSWGDLWAWGFHREDPHLSVERVWGSRGLWVGEGSYEGDGGPKMGVLL